MSGLLLVMAAALICGGAWAQEGVQPQAEEGAALTEAVQLVPETLPLELAIELALEYNPQVGAAEQEVKASRGLLTQALSRLMPRLEAGTRRVTPVDLPPFSFQSTDSSWETDFTLTQLLYTGGSIRQGVRAANDYLRGSASGYRRTQQEVAFAVRQTYYQVLTAEEGVKVAEEVVGSAQEHLRVARLRYEAGMAPQFDVLAAEARVARVEQGLISARADRDIAWAALASVLGVPIPETTRLTTPRPVAVTVADLETLRQEAVETRPDLVAASAGVAAARAQLAVARAAGKPTVAGTLQYTLREKTTIAGEAFGSPGIDIVVAQNSGYIALSASWSLFNGGQVYGEIKTAEARLKQAEKGVEGVKQQIDLEVKSAHLLLEAAGARVGAAQKEADQAQEAHRIATLRYDEGVGTSVEILDAEANLEGAKTRLNEAIFGLNLAVAQVDLAVGRDWGESGSSGGGPEEIGE